MTKLELLECALRDLRDNSGLIPEFPLSLSKEMRWLILNALSDLGLVDLSPEDNLAGDAVSRSYQDRAQELLVAYNLVIASRAWSNPDPIPPEELTKLRTWACSQRLRRILVELDRKQLPQSSPLPGLEIFRELRKWELFSDEPVVEAAGHAGPTASRAADEPSDLPPQLCHLKAPIIQDEEQQKAYMDRLHLWAFLRQLDPLVRTIIEPLFLAGVKPSQSLDYPLFDDKPVVADEGRKKAYNSMLAEFGDRSKFGVTVRELLSEEVRRLVQLVQNWSQLSKDRYRQSFSDAYEQWTSKNQGHLLSCLLKAKNQLSELNNEWSQAENIHEKERLEVIIKSQNEFIEGVKLYFTEMTIFFARKDIFDCSGQESGQEVSPELKKELLRLGLSGSDIAKLRLRLRPQDRSPVEVEAIVQWLGQVGLEKLPGKGKGKERSKEEKQRERVCETFTKTCKGVLSSWLAADESSDAWEAPIAMLAIQRTIAFIALGKTDADGFTNQLIKLCAEFKAKEAERAQNPAAVTLAEQQDRKQKLCTEISQVIYSSAQKKVVADLMLAPPRFSLWTEFLDVCWGGNKPIYTRDQLTVLIENASSLAVCLEALHYNRKALGKTKEDQRKACVEILQQRIQPRKKFSRTSVVDLPSADEAEPRKDEKNDLEALMDYKQLLTGKGFMSLFVDMVKRTIRKGSEMVLDHLVQSERPFDKKNEHFAGHQKEYMSLIVRAMKMAPANLRGTRLSAATEKFRELRKDFLKHPEYLEALLLDPSLNTQVRKELEQMILKDKSWFSKTFLQALQEQSKKPDSKLDLLFLLSPALYLQIKPGMPNFDASKLSFSKIPLDYLENWLHSVLAAGLVDLSPDIEKAEHIFRRSTRAGDGQLSFEQNRAVEGLFTLQQSQVKSLQSVAQELPGIVLERIKASLNSKLCDADKKVVENSILVSARTERSDAASSSLLAQEPMPAEEPTSFQAQVQGWSDLPVRACSGAEQVQFIQEHLKRMPVVVNENILLAIGNNITIDYSQYHTLLAFALSTGQGSCLPASRPFLHQALKEKQAEAIKKFDQQMIELKDFLKDATCAEFAAVKLLKEAVLKNLLLADSKYYLELVDFIIAGNITDPNLRELIEGTLTSTKGECAETFKRQQKACLKFLGSKASATVHSQLSRAFDEQLELLTSCGAVVQNQTVKKRWWPFKDEVTLENSVTIAEGGFIEYLSRNCRVYGALTPALNLPAVPASAAADDFTADHFTASDQPQDPAHAVAAHTEASDSEVVATGPSGPSLADQIKCELKSAAKAQENELQLLSILNKAYLLQGEFFRLQKRLAYSFYEGDYEVDIKGAWEDLKKVLGDYEKIYSAFKPHSDKRMPALEGLINQALTACDFKTLASFKVLEKLQVQYHQKVSSIVLLLSVRAPGHWDSYVEQIEKLEALDSELKFIKKHLFPSVLPEDKCPLKRFNFDAEALVTQFVEFNRLAPGGDGSRLGQKLKRIISSGNHNPDKIKELCQRIDGGFDPAPTGGRVSPSHSDPGSGEYVGGLDSDDDTDDDTDDTAAPDSSALPPQRMGAGERARADSTAALIIKTGSLFGPRSAAGSAQKAGLALPGDVSSVGAGP